jgi:HEAT repeat protein
VRDELAHAARQPGGAELAGLRARLREPTAVLIAALIDAYVAAHETHRPALVDWMEALQPLDAPAWTLIDRAAARCEEVQGASARRPRATDLDQPRSQPLRDRLEAMLDAPAVESRNQAAVALLGWPEPEPQARVAEAYLRGAVEIAPSPALAAAVLGLGRERVLQGLRDPRARPRLVPLLASDPEWLDELVPVLLDVHDEAFDAGDPETCDLVLGALGAASPDRLLAALAGRFAADDFRLADAVTGDGRSRTAGAAPAATRRLRASPELAAAIEHARRSGRDWLVERWRELEVRPETLRESRDAFAERVADLRGRSPAAAAGPAPDREALLRDATTGAPDAARRALTVLARDPDPSVVALLHDRLGHPHPRVRLHAHRLLRSCETREAYLEATLRLLADPIDDVRRSAIRTVGHARFAPAVPALVALLTDKSLPVRTAAAEALVHLGEPSRGALRRALAGARPDRRDVYAQVLERLGTDDA